MVGDHHQPRGLQVPTWKEAIKDRLKIISFSKSQTETGVRNHTGLSQRCSKKISRRLKAQV